LQLILQGQVDDFMEEENTYVDDYVDWLKLVFNVEKKKQAIFESTSCAEVSVLLQVHKVESGGSHKNCVATPLWVKWEDETPTPKVGDLESSGTPERLKFDSRGQNTSHWGVLGVIGKVLKCRCPKCPRIGHLDIRSLSYGQKKGRESNWQFDSQPLKVGNRPLPNIRIGSATWRWKALEETYNFGLDLVLIRLGSQEI
jgi:hypothetical protein